MENLFEFIKLYTIAFAVLINGYYFIPVVIWYYFFFIKNRVKWKHMRIQKYFPEGQQIIREIKYSVLSIAIFSLVSAFLLLAIQKGLTKMYFNISDYGIIYFIISPVIAFLIHDTVFYWTHRFMHHKKVFRYFHLIHHKSTNPTPFSIYAFQPGEAIIQSSIYPIIIFLLPIHPFMLIFFMAYNMFINLAGHAGFEFMPGTFRNHRIFKWQNSVTNHDLHHTKFNYNYGFYFTFWDRVMKTLYDENVKTK